MGLAGTFGLLSTNLLLSRLMRNDWDLFNEEAIAELVLDPSGSGLDRLSDPLR